MNETQVDIYLTLWSFFKAEKMKSSDTKEAKISFVNYIENRNQHTLKISMKYYNADYFVSSKNVMHASFCTWHIFYNKLSA